jgi:hypothetical protein
LLTTKYDNISTVVDKHGQNLLLLNQSSKELNEKRSSEKIIFDSLVNEANCFMNGLQKDA